MGRCRGLGLGLHFFWINNYFYIYNGYFYIMGVFFGIVFFFCIFEFQKRAIVLSLREYLKPNLKFGLSVCIFK